MSWTDLGFLAEAVTWVDERVAERGWIRSGPVEQPHVRPWATALRVPTSGGVVWFKASLPVLGHEPALLELLATLSPDAVPRLLAVDRDRGWTLTADAGQRMRGSITIPAELVLWDPVLHRYAALQQAAMGDVPALLATGCPDHRGDRLVALVADLLDDDAAVLAGRPDGLSDDDRRELGGLLPRLAEAAAQATAVGPDTVEHDDLHDGNVFVADGHGRLADWGDARTAPAFASLVVLTRTVAHRLRVRTDGPELSRLWRVYLEAWTSSASTAERFAAARAAYPVGLVLRGLSWHLITRSLDGDERAEHADGLAHFLRETLHALRDGVPALPTG